MPVSKKKAIYVGSKISQNQRILLENAVSEGDYLNISGFVRDAIKEKLQREGFLSSTLLSKGDIIYSEEKNNLSSLERGFESPQSSESKHIGDLNSHE